MQENLKPFIAVCWKSAMLYDKCLSGAALAYGLTRNEKDVLLFLHNNAPLDTAGDIVKYRSISKSLVAKSVASLTGRGFLTQRPDPRDARFVHLCITGAAMQAVGELKRAQDEFFGLFEGSLPPKEKHRFCAMLRRIEAHIDRYLEGR